MLKNQTIVRIPPVKNVGLNTVFWGVGVAVYKTAEGWTFEATFWGSWKYMANLYHVVGRGEACIFVKPVSLHLAEEHTFGPQFSVFVPVRAWLAWE